MHVFKRGIALAQDDRGTATVEMVILMAAGVGLALATFGVTGQGVGAASGNISTVLASDLTHVSFDAPPMEPVPEDIIFGEDIPMDEPSS
ncbi:hypothetical protein [Jannaschia rubra]|uniref:Flp pilus assembly protein, pilin Flp n=1 Tax=Jannaschia rubra TaxID=282197 RepID=A0A0M6XPC8_9RHOB|nr:hypothetical protein [Jannaschia rubra]CTQ32033.1 hypothetical protein JAN5088_00793 [Jannaschia rubra]SFG39320.1 hypothetical protein SAMN04488517_104201 [Jannaschia rubra]